MTNNIEIKNNIINYLEEESYPHAILLNGKWGTGKTHFIKDIISEHNQKVKNKNESIIYFSLNGESDIKLIKQKIFQKNIPLLNDKIKKFSKNINQIDFGNKINNLKNLTYSIADLFMFQELKDKKIFFDDLERCKCELSELFGFFSDLIEDGNNKVIIISDENKIKDSEMYKEIKEKVIGKTLYFNVIDLGIFDTQINKEVEKFNKKSNNSQFKNYSKKIKNTINAYIKEDKITNLRLFQKAIYNSFNIIYNLKDSINKSQSHKYELIELIVTKTIDLILIEKDIKNKNENNLMINFVRHAYFKDKTEENIEEELNIYIYSIKKKEIENLKTEEIEEYIDTKLYIEFYFEMFFKILIFLQEEKITQKEYNILKSKIENHLLSINEIITIKESPKYEVYRYDNSKLYKSSIEEYENLKKTYNNKIKEIREKHFREILSIDKYKKEFEMKINYYNEDNGEYFLKAILDDLIDIIEEEKLKKFLNMIKNSKNYNIINELINFKQKEEL